MENATKALLMAAGILIAIVVLSLAIFMYGRVSSYYQTKQRNTSQEQIAAFNNEFTVYNRDDVSGFEMVSLINKAIDFNQNEVFGASNTENDTAQTQGYTEMQIDVVIRDNFSYYGEADGLFDRNKTYTYNGKNSGSRKDLSTKIEEMQKLERKASPSDLTKLTSYITEISSSEKTVETVTGKNYNVTVSDIKKYADYLTFKRGTFICTKMDYDKYGQIYYFIFEQIK